MDLSKIRHALHSLAEISGLEIKTADFISSLLSSYKPQKLITRIGGTGILAEFKFPDTGPKVLIRADLDALPDLVGASHRCGHDGHMTLALSLLDHLSEFKRGSLFLFFQPAEETGAGALACLNDPVFKDLSFDAVFGLHNLPGYPLGKVVLCEKTFACSSVGLQVKIQGRSSHAAEPQKALSPFPLMQELSALCEKMTITSEDENFQLATLTHLKLGEESFGITPGHGEVYITLRSFLDSSLGKMKEKIKETCRKEGFTISFGEHDYFPATCVDGKIVKKMKDLFQEKKIPFQVNDFPFRWSEDFGYLTQKYPGVYFGLGSGVDCKPLHDTHYEFPDELLKQGSEIYRALVSSYLA